MKIIVTRFVLALLVLAAARVGAAPPAVTTIFLVRHAEKGFTPGLADLPLTAAGQARAQPWSAAVRGPSGNAFHHQIPSAPTPPWPRWPPPAWSHTATMPTTLGLGRYSAPHLCRAGGSRGGPLHTLLLLIPVLGPPLPVPEIGDAEDSCLFKVRVPARCLAMARVRLRVVLIAKALATGAQAVLIGTFGQPHDLLISLLL